MIDFNELMKRGEDYAEGMQKGRELAIQKYDKILVELWDKMSDIEKKIDKLFTYLITFKELLSKIGDNSEVEK